MGFTKNTNYVFLDSTARELFVNRCETNRKIATKVMAAGGVFQITESKSENGAFDVVINGRPLSIDSSDCYFVRNNEFEYFKEVGKIEESSTGIESFDRAVASVKEFYGKDFSKETEEVLRMVGFAIKLQK